VPGLLPIEVHLVDEDSHQFRHGQCRMCIVHLNRDFVRKQTPIQVATLESPNCIGQRARYEKVLLHEPQALAHYP
jgi:hypothetical protein